MDVSTLASDYARPRVLIADDHVLVAEGLERLLLDCFELVGIAKDGRRLVQAVRETVPDVVIADIGMPHMSGLEALRLLREQGDLTPFVFLTMHSEAALAVEALRLGAAAYVLKTAAGEELVHAIREVLDGGTYVTPSLGAQLITGGAPAKPINLTDKQLQVLALVALGLRSKQVAYELGISIRTVESHKYAIMQALEVHSTVELVRKAEQAGLVPAVVPEP